MTEQKVNERLMKVAQVIVGCESVGLRMALLSGVNIPSYSALTTAKRAINSSAYGLCRVGLLKHRAPIEVSRGKAGLDSEDFAVAQLPIWKLRDSVRSPVSIQRHAPFLPFSSDENFMFISFAMLAGVYILSFDTAFNCTPSATNAEAACMHG